MLTIQQFCDNHFACSLGKDWAIVHCSSMTDAWDKLRPEWLVWVATRSGVLNDKELRLFAVFCMKQISHLLTDNRSFKAIEVAEKFAIGLVSKRELASAYMNAVEAARDAARIAINVNGAYDLEACAAKSDGAYAAYCVLSEDACFGARVAARTHADLGVTNEIAWMAQADWLRANTSPVFD